MKYDAEVRAAIARWAPGLDPALVHAVIQKESSHVKLITSEPGNRFSYGPMMVLDSTARGMGASNPAALMVPAVGIDYGVRYLADMMRRFPGDSARAVSAYNTGPGNAVRNAAGRFPNQDYVTKVLGFWKLYRGAGAGAGALVVFALVAGAAYALKAGRRRAA